MIEPIPGVRGARAFYIQNGAGTVIIDPGYTGSVSAVLRFLDARALPPPELVVLTHHHIDHAGTALAVCERTGARLAIHRDDAGYLKHGRPRDRMTLWGVADRLPNRMARFLVSCADCEVRLLEDEEVIAGLRVIHAAGHTPGSICLWSESESALFTGDVVNNERGIGTPPWTVNHSHAIARRAPQKLMGLRYQRAYFGHGPAILEDADRRVGEFLESRGLGEQVGAFGAGKVEAKQGR